MKNILHDISKIIDPVTLNILKSINDKASLLGIDYFIVGAVARDIILNYKFGMPVERKTNDIDICIKVRSWDDFNNFVQKLSSEGLIEKSNSVHRYIFDKRTLIDIIPFGEIGRDKQEIIWPDENNLHMTVMGFDESYNNSEKIIIHQDPEIIVRFASLDGLVVLKLLAWDEKYPERKKDAQDIINIINHYLKAGNLNRLYNENSDLMELSPDTFDEKLLGARLIGRDISKWITQTTYDKIVEILSTQLNEDTNSNFILDIISSNAGKINYNEDYSYYLSVMKQLLNGLKD